MLAAASIERNAEKIMKAIQTVDYIVGRNYVAYVSHRKTRMKEIKSMINMALLSGDILSYET